MPCGVADWDAELKTVQHVYRVSKDGVEEKPIPEDQPHTRSGLVAPLIREGQVVGAVRVVSYRLDAYSDEDLRTLEAILQHLTAARANAQLYQSAQTGPPNASAQRSASRASTALTPC